MNPKVLTLSNGKINPLLNTADNIKNTLVHEYKHQKDANESFSTKKAELRAIKAQKIHSTYNKTTDEYKCAVEKYEVFNKNRKK